MAANGGVKPIELANVLGIDRSSAYRLLYTLMYKGYLIQDPAIHSKFFLNPGKILHLSGTVFRDIDWFKLAHEAIVSLCEVLGETSMIGILSEEGDTAIYIDQKQTDDVIRVVNTLGVRRPLYASSIGKAIIAFKPPGERNRLIEKCIFEKFTSNTITDPQSLLVNLETVVQLGYAVDNEEYINGVRCISSPIFNNNGDVIASIGISGASTRIKPQNIPGIAKVIFENAKKISNAQGYFGKPYE
jgi:IclR family transcriptional regulator, KDG regulon repressor